MRRGRHLICGTNDGFGFGVLLVLWSLLLLGVARREVVVVSRVKEEEGLLLL